MDNILAMAIWYCTHNLSEIMLGLVLRKKLFLSEEFQKFPSLQVLHNDVNLHVFEHVAVDDLYNVGMVEGFEILNLPENHVNVTGTTYFTEKLHIFYTLIIFTAANYLVIIFYARTTFPKPPSPNGFKILYSPKFDY